MTSELSPHPRERPRYRIGKVAELLNMSTHALRAWERRYGVVVPQRTSGGGRLYSEQDVNRLSLVKRLTDLGHSIGSVASLDEAALKQRLSMHGVEQAPERGALGLRREYMAALRGMDLVRAERVLMQAALTLEPRSFVMELAAPLLTEIGDAWQSAELCVAEEHAASAMLRSQLGALLRSFVRSDQQPPVVVTTPAGELHEFGALMAGVLAALGGYRVIYLGANLPAPEIARAGTLSGARLLLLSLVADGNGAGAEIEQLAQLLPAQTRIIAGGRAAQHVAPALSSLRVVRDLAELERVLEEALPRAAKAANAGAR